MTSDLTERLRNCIYIKFRSGYQSHDLGMKAADEIERLTRALAEAREALERQSDNMAFVVNHVGLSDAWMEKFQRELEEDRRALKEKP